MEKKAPLIFSQAKQSLFNSVSLLGILIISSLQGCASSDVSRSASGDFHSTYQNAASAFNSESINVTEAYEGSSQRTKGVLIGGATGAIVGGVASGGSGIIPGAAGGAIFGGALGAYIDSKTTVADKIINRGNTVVVLGDQVLLVLPSKYMFVEGTPRLQPYSYRTLDLVSHFISAFPNMSIKVTAYSSSVLPSRITRSLSQEQANAVVKYLWHTNINTRMLYAEGGGDSKPIAMTDSEINNRVEITLEKLPV